MFLDLDPGFAVDKIQLSIVRIGVFADTEDLIGEAVLCFNRRLLLSLCVCPTLPDVGVC